MLFAIALFISGQSSTLTGTIAGQVILEGFLDLKIPCWKQRLFTRLTALTPAWIAISIYGDAILGKLLVLSQVVLSMQLPFAVVPLIMFNSEHSLMGEWQLRPFMRSICWIISFAIISANIYLLIQLLS